MGWGGGGGFQCITIREQLWKAGLCWVPKQEKERTPVHSSLSVAPEGHRPTAVAGVCLKGG